MTNVYMIDKINHGGGGEISIKFVGTASDIIEINEIVNICKVFLIERWLDNIQYSSIHRNVVKTGSNSSKKIDVEFTDSTGHIPILTVKGLN